MSDYRLTSEVGDVIDSATLDNDQLAVAWRSARPFTEASTDEGRQLRLEKLAGEHWFEIEPLSTSESS